MRYPRPTRLEYTAAMLDLPRLWLSPGGEAVPWRAEGRQIYARVSWEELPPLLPCDGSFAWLAPLPAGINGMENGMWELRGEAAVRARLAALDTEARALGGALPADFIRFMTTPSLSRRVPSCTGCYFDLPSDDEDGEDNEDNEDNADDEAHADPDDQHDTPSYLLPVPGHPGNARLLRFMSELANQWYLLLEGDEPPRVAMGYLDPKNDFRMTDLAVCADSFETFIRRFWIENLLWFRHSAGEPIDGELRAYLDEARARLIGR